MVLVSTLSWKNRVVGRLWTIFPNRVGLPGKDARIEQHSSDYYAHKEESWLDGGARMVKRRSKRTSDKVLFRYPNIRYLLSDGAFLSSDGVQEP